MFLSQSQRLKLMNTVCVEPLMIVNVLGRAENKNIFIVNCEVQLI